ncbi:MAG: ATPase domain-containing protein [Acidobacteriaceae bacterium]
MPTAAHLRAEIEAALAPRIPSALTPAPRIFRSVVPTGIESLDQLLEGGLPVGAITEITGPECSGRTSLALSFLAGMTRAAKVCAWIDVSDALDPESAAAAGVDLERLLWVRCGVSARKKTQLVSASGFVLPGKYLVAPPITKGLHGGGFGPHPRGEGKGLPDAIHDFFGRNGMPSRCADSPPVRIAERTLPDSHPAQPSWRQEAQGRTRKPWPRIEQALRVTDLLLQAGGFSAIVLDMGSLAPEYASRVPLATWFRYRAAAEHSQTSLLLLTQQACAKSSAGLVLHMQTGRALQEEVTVLTGVQHGVEVARERFQPVPGNVVPMRKPPQSERCAGWQSRTAWAGER